MINPDEDSNDSRFVWKLKDSGAQVVERMTLSGSGNMRLMGDLYIDNPHPGIVFYENETDAADKHWWRLVGDTGHIRLDYDNDQDGAFSPYTTGWAQLPNGNVGIGDTSPVTKLEVVGSSSSRVAQFTNNNTGNTQDGIFISLHHDAPTADGYWIACHDNNGVDLEWGLRGDGSDTGATIHDPSDRRLNSCDEKSNSSN